MLCISTSQRVLRTPFAGQNRLSDAKTTFSITNDLKALKKLFQHQKIDFDQPTACRAPVCQSKYTTSIFGPANQAPSTRSVIKIYNKQYSSFSISGFKVLKSLEVFRAKMKLLETIDFFISNLGIFIKRANLVTAWLPPCLEIELFLFKFFTQNYVVLRIIWTRMFCFDLK